MLLSNLPLASNISLLYGFENVKIRSVTYVNDNLEEVISVSDDDNCMEFLYNESESITNLMISDNLCNEYPISMIDFSRYDKLYNIDIGDGNFEYVSEFRIDGLNDLKSLIIGKNSFRMNDGNDGFRSFHVLNCDELESI